MPRKPRTNRFSGDERAVQISPTRRDIERFLLDNPGTHSADAIAAATGHEPADVRKKLANMVTDFDAISTDPGSKNTRYQHREHWQREQVVTSRDPITNSRMPNGSTEYWAAHMARFNANPREGLR